MAPNSPTYAREDLMLGADDQSSPPTVAFVRTEWRQKFVVGAIVGTLSLGPTAAAGTTYHCIQAQDRPTHASLLVGQEATVQVMSPPSKIGLVDAIRLAEANYRRVEDLLRREVERDALGTAVWEEE